MTEYGRGQGSEPWHPEDPLYGDGGWEGQQPHPGHQPAYDGQPLVMLRLTEVDVDRLAELVTDAWRMRAPEELLADLQQP